MAVSTELTELVNDLLEAPGTLISQTIKDRWITQAVTGRYSRDRPRIRYVDLTPNGTQRIPLGATLLAAIVTWTPVDSFIESIEYPIGSRPKDVIDTDLCGLYPEDVEPSQVTDIDFFSQAPNSSVSNVRVRYRALHSAGTGSGANETTVPSGDRAAVACLAAHYIFKRLATSRVGAKATGLRADGVGWQAQTGDFLKLSEDMLAEYNQYLHPDESEIEAACASSVPIPRTSADTEHLLRPYQRRLVHRMRR